MRAMPLSLEEADPASLTADIAVLDFNGGTHRCVPGLHRLDNDASSFSVAIVLGHLTKHIGSEDDANDTNGERQNGADENSQGHDDLHLPETILLRLLVEFVSICLPSRCCLHVVARRHDGVLAKCDLLLLLLTWVRRRLD